MRTSDVAAVRLAELRIDGDGRPLLRGARVGVHIPAALGWRLHRGRGSLIHRTKPTSDRGHVAEKHVDEARQAVGGHAEVRPGVW